MSDSNGLPAGGPAYGLVANEFAEVAVEINGDALSPRLRLEDLKTGRVRYLDALELETIVWLADGHLRRLLDPSSDRWREDQG